MEYSASAKIHVGYVLLLLKCLSFLFLVSAAWDVKLMAGAPACILASLEYKTNSKESEIKQANPDSLICVEPCIT